ncbi:uncharacterized protein RSE6_14192 [Rhynchosporium secalis]|uniref:LysM domain-containing protein n=1 Tax=Rhynchosporium secalis TaxID=38038 RepID=A0A1E1MUT0_RHYSE|nr:uncharacterized protein RSE6_14192 [Rhynchosporium secalis]
MFVHSRSLTLKPSPSFKMPLFRCQIAHFVFIFLLSAFAYGQQFTDLPLPASWPGISDLCFNALNSTVSCPAFLGVVSVDNERLNAEQLTSLCTASCLSSLNSVRQTIIGGCKAADDKILLDDIVYPATYIVDRFIYTYDLACRKDSATGKYCDTLLMEWLNQDELTAEQECSECILGISQTQLNSPFGYDEELAADFRYDTSSCGAKGYDFTVPGTYSSTSSPTVTATTTATSAISTCTNSYTVQAGDSCDAIALARNVSTFSIVNPNGINRDCTNLQAGASICLSSPCDLYRVQSLDTCNGIIAAQGDTITGSQLLAWNPNLNALCGNIDDLVSTFICVGPPGGSIGVVVPTITLAISTPTKAVPKPTNAYDESTADCGKWYEVQEGDNCDKLSVQFGISNKDLLFLNPEINVECTNLNLGISYCIQAVGDISTYTRYSTSRFFTLTTGSYTTATTTTFTEFPVSTVTSQPQLPLASGSLTNCSRYRNYEEPLMVQDQSQSKSQVIMTGVANRCYFIASSFGVAFADFLAWNPSLSGIAENCTINSGFSYCALLDATKLGDIVTANYCEVVDSTFIHENTISTCSCFITIQAYDDSESYPCAAVADDYSISVEDLTTWNPWLGSDCDTGLYSGIIDDQANAVCIGVNETAQTATATSGPSVSSTISSGPIGPTQPGIIASCTKFYTTVDNDSCAAIQAKFAIIFAQFYAWNPAVGSNCENLWLQEAYCVSAPSSKSTSAPTPTSTSHDPIRPGTPDNCTTYYNVASGDCCNKIINLFGISFATLYEWNPSLGDDCQNLWPDYAVCVAGGT